MQSVAKRSNGSDDSTAAGAVLLAFSAVSASAAYACNGNVCWQTKEKYTYPADSKVVVHEESWKPSAADRLGAWCGFLRQLFSPRLLALGNNYTRQAIAFVST